jgi:hypothetical protein
VATRTTITWLQQAIDEGLRRDGHFRALVERTLAAQAPDEAWTPESNGVWATRVERWRPARATPTSDELAGALRESGTPEAICAYVLPKVHDWHEARAQNTAAGRGRGQQIAEDCRADEERLRRLIVHYESSDIGWTIRQLARELGRSDRTIRRHLKALDLQLPARLSRK